MNEYRVIFEFPDYMLSNQGEVRNHKTGKVIKTDHNTSWYVALRKDGKTYQRGIKKLINVTFPRKM